jgi:hypothetical protein
MITSRIRTATLENFNKARIRSPRAIRGSLRRLRESLIAGKTTTAAKPESEVSRDFKLVRFLLRCSCSRAVNVFILSEERQSGQRRSRRIA